MPVMLNLLVHAHQSRNIVNSCHLPSPSRKIACALQPLVQYIDKAASFAHLPSIWSSSVCLSTPDTCIVSACHPHPPTVAPTDAADALFDDPFSTILLEDNAPTYDNTTAAMGAESGLVADSGAGAANTTDASLGSSVAALFDGTQATADGTGDAALGLYDDLFAAGNEQQLDGAAGTQDAEMAGPADADVAGLPDADVAALAGVLDGMGLGQLGDLLTGADAQDAATGGNTGTVGDAYDAAVGDNTGTVGDASYDNTGDNTGTVGDAYYDNTGDNTGTVGDAYDAAMGDNTGTAGAAYDESYAADGAHGDYAYDGDGGDAAYYGSGYADVSAYGGTDAYGDAAFDPSYDYDAGNLSLGAEMNALGHDIMVENVV